MVWNINSIFPFIGKNNPNFRIQMFLEGLTCFFPGKKHGKEKASKMCEKLGEWKLSMILKSEVDVHVQVGVMGIQ